MGKVFVRIYKYEQRNWPYPCPNTTFEIQQRSETSIQTKCNSAYDASVGAHDEEQAGLYQGTNHHGNTYARINDDSQ